MSLGLDGCYWDRGGGTRAYLAITFPLAFVWHLVVFKETYERLGYLRKWVQSAIRFVKTLPVK